MNEKLRSYSDKLSNFWKSKSKKQKIVGISSIALIILIIILIGYFSTRTTMEPLYSNLSAAEAGSIKENLDSKGIKSEIADNGKQLKFQKSKLIH